MPMRSRSKTLSGRAAEAATICPARRAAGALTGSAGVAGRAAVSRSTASAGAPASVLAVMAESCRADPASAHRPCTAESEPAGLRASRSLM